MNRQPRFQFSTDHVRANLKRSTVRGAAVTLVSGAVQFSLRMIGVVVLARLLTPEDYGLIAMAGAFLWLADMFLSAGLTEATVQRQELTHEEVSTLFWFNAGFGASAGAILFLLAPAVAWFYGESRLTEITMVVALTLVISGLGTQHLALLRRQMKYLSIAIAIVIAQVASLIVGITSAFLGAGYWALVYMGVTGAAVRMIAMWNASGWVPGRASAVSRVRGMLVFGGNLTAARFVNYLVRNGDNVLIGAVWGAMALGLYSKAYQLLMMPVTQISQPVGAVAVPALSRLQTDPGRFRGYYRSGMFLIVSLGLPMVAFALSSTEELVLVVLGNQWGGVVPIFYALGPAALIGTLDVATDWVFLPLGRADRKLRAEIFGGIITLTAYAVGIHWGAIGIAWAFSISVVIIRPWQIEYAFRDSPLGFGDLWAAIWRPTVASAFAAGAVVLSRGYSEQYENVETLVMKLAIFGLCYVSAFFLLPGGRDALVLLREGWKELRGKSGKTEPGAGAPR